MRLLAPERSDATLLVHVRDTLDCQNQGSGSQVSIFRARPIQLLKVIGWIGGCPSSEDPCYLFSRIR